jgi:thiamine monophosphate kinase
MASRVIRAGESSGCAVTRIGRANAETRVRFAAADGKEMEIKKPGWAHF